MLYSTSCLFQDQIGFKNVSQKCKIHIFNKLIFIWLFQVQNEYRACDITKFPSKFQKEEMDIFGLFR